MMQKRVVHIIAGLNIGGANLMLLKLLSATDRNQFDPNVIVLMDSGTLGKRIEALDISLYTLGLQKGRPTPKALWRLADLLKVIQPDLIQSWMYHGNAAAVFGQALASSRAPLIWNIRHTPYDLADEKWLTRQLIRLGAQFSKKPERIIYNASVSAERHEALGYDASRRMIIPNGFDLNQFQPSPQSRHKLRHVLGLEERTMLIGMAARYHPMKDHANFVRAASILSAQRQDVHFVLVGREIDAQNSELTGLIRQHGISNRVHLLGERADMPDILAGLDLATMTSAWGEGFPNIIGEAMACQVPCVVTDVGDSAHIVGDAGMAVISGNSQALSAAWARILNLTEPERRALGAAGRKRIEEHYSLPAITAKYEDLYQQIIQEKQYEAKSKLAW